MPSLLRTVCLSLAMLATCDSAHAQAPAQPPAYDIVSIKPNKTGSGSWGIHSGDGRFSATNVSLQSLLVTAFDVKEYLISGVPKEFNSARFDIEAKIVEPDLPALKKLTEQQERAMVLPILTERFHFKSHAETKILPVYELVLLPVGPKFKPAADPNSGSMHTENRNLTAAGIPMTSLANLLSYQVQRTVLDKTGLAEHYDLTLKWSPEDDPDPQPNSPPALFTALQEQLGLKLRPGKGPVETLVVDHVEMPTEN